MSSHSPGLSAHMNHGVKNRSNPDWFSSCLTKFQPLFEGGFPHGHDQGISATTTGGRARPWRLRAPKPALHDRPRPYFWYWPPIATTSHGKYYHLGPGGLPA